MAQADKLIQLREHYKSVIEQRLRDNKLHGINFVIGQTLDELFNELIPLLKEKGDL